MGLVLRLLLRRFAATLMLAAAAAFVLQGTLLATSEAATGSSSRYHHGHPHGHAPAGGDEHVDSAHSHVVAHVHTDGTVHSHAVDDDDLDDHIKEHGCACCWNMAVALGVLPAVIRVEVAAIAGSKLAIEPPAAQHAADPNRLKRPPRPPSIA
jgi:ABC-type nickel/cobalt efflux system permease component RcnA